MNDFLELPLVEPIFKTYQYDGTGAAIIKNNLSIRNWYLNKSIDLKCNCKFLTGYTSPEVKISPSTLDDNPYLQKFWLSTKLFKGCINTVICNMLDNGYYVYFVGADDYYIKGKSWYKERHFKHDALICGYNRVEKTYCIFSYDNRWICRKFWTTQASFDKGRKAIEKLGENAMICIIKPKDEKVEFNIKEIIKNMRAYLASNVNDVVVNDNGYARGQIVHKYLAEYVSKLYDGSIPYERMDRRVFCLVWEHKKAMLERIEKIEQFLQLDNEVSKKYRALVSEADTMRMLYASHHMKRRDSVLPIIKNKLLKLMDDEKELLMLFITKVAKELENGTVEISQK